MSAHPLAGRRHTRRVRCERCDRTFSAREVAPLRSWVAEGADALCLACHPYTRAVRCWGCDAAFDSGGAEVILVSGRLERVCDECARDLGYRWQASGPIEWALPT